MGPFGSVHPRHKQVVGSRLAAAALTQVYKQNVPYIYPTFASSSAAANGNVVTVTVTLSNVGTSLNFQPAHCPTELGVPADICAWWSVIGKDGVWYNATAAITGGGQSVAITATLAAGVAANGTAYGYGTWPVITLYNNFGLPVLPWMRNL